MSNFIFFLIVGFAAGFAIKTLWQMHWDTKALGEYTKILVLIPQNLIPGNLAYVLQKLEMIRMDRKSKMITARQYYLLHKELRENVEEWAKNHPLAAAQPYPDDEEHQQGVKAIQEKYPWVKA